MLLSIAILIASCVLTLDAIQSVISLHQKQEEHGDKSLSISTTAQLGFLAFKNPSAISTNNVYSHTGGVAGLIWSMKVNVPIVWFIANATSAIENQPFTQALLP
jgi:hypothetical protein